MNGAQSLVQTLLNAGIDTCFANPGTSEMHFVAALDEHPAMRCVLGLAEGVVTAAADGYARMTGRPAATLLHCGPGLANGIANLHNARRAGTPMVNIVGDHATYHRAYDAPLTSDVEGLARPVSHWLRTSLSPATVGRDGAAAVAAAHGGQIATLILPADTAWGEGGVVGKTIPPPDLSAVPEARIQAAARWLRNGQPSLLLISGGALGEAGLDAAARIAAGTGATVMCPTSPRTERGGNLPYVERVPYSVDAARNRLAGFRQAILVGCRAPVAFFGYPGKPSEMLPEDCRIQVLTRPGEDPAEALLWLAEDLDADAPPPPTREAPPTCPDGPLTPEALAAIVARHLPENCIVADESISAGRAIYPTTRHAPRHTWLSLTGGAIGIGMPLALGAALGAPGRRVLNLQADGSALYTLQALWTQARENLPITTVVLANRAYAILKGEMSNVGAGQIGPRARDLMELERPTPDWVALAAGLGVEAARAGDAGALDRLLEAALSRTGPFLIEAVL